LRFLRDLTFAAFAREKEQQRIAVDFFTAKTQSTQRKCTNLSMYQCANVQMTVLCGFCVI